MLCRAVAFGGAVCVLGIRPYATRAPLDDLGYRMLSAKHGDIVYAERPIESSVKYDYSSPVRHMNKRPGFGDISVAIHDANEVATSIKLPTK